MAGVSLKQYQQMLPICSSVAPAKTSPWAGLSEMTAVASTVDARSKVSAPEVVICPEGVTVTGKAKRHLIHGHIRHWAGSMHCFLEWCRLQRDPRSRHRDISHDIRKSVTLAPRGKSQRGWDLGLYPGCQV